MMTLDILNTLGRLLLTLIVVVKVTRFRDTMNMIERVSAGVMGSGSFLTIAVIWERTGSPFEGWSTTLLTYGAVGFMFGRTIRDWKHDHRNQSTISQAIAYLQSKGKL